MKLLSPLLRAIFLAPLLTLLPLLPIHGQLFMDNNGTSSGFGDSSQFNTSTWSVGGTNWTENADGTGPLIMWNNTSGATTFRFTALSPANIRVEDDFTVSGLRLDGGGGDLRLGRGTAGDPNPTVAITVQTGGEVFVENGRTLAIGFTNAPVSLQGSFTKTGGGTLLFNSASGQIGAANITIEEGTINTGTNNLGSTTSFALNGGNLIIQAGSRSIGSLSGTSGNVNTVQGSTPGALTINQTTDGVFAGVIGPNTHGTATRSVTKDGAAMLTLTGHQTYDGTMTISAGTLQIGNGGTTGNLSDTNTINNAALIFNRSNDSSYGQVISGSGTVTKTGAGTMTLTGTNSYSGVTTVSGGTLLIDGTGALTNTSGITVNSGGTFRYDSTTALNRAVTLNTGGTFAHNGTSAYTGTLTWNGGTLAGTNFSGVSLTVGANKTLSPGNSPGTMLTASQTWENGGNYNLQIFDFAQAAGTGFDTIAITGTLDLTAVTAGGFNINLWSLSAIGPDVDGDALNFDNLASGSWLIVSTTGGISGFDPSKFTIHVGANNGTAGFSNDLGGGTFSISLVDNDLFLNFTAIPEPSSVLLFGLGLAALALRKRCSLKKI